MENIKIISQSNQINDFTIVGKNENWKLLYVHSGELTVTLNDSVYNLQPNTVVFISPEDFYFVKPNTALFTSLTFKNNIDFKNKVLQLEHSENELFNSFLQVEDQYQSETMFQLFLVLCSKYTDNFEPILYKNKKSRLYEKAVSVMEGNILSWITVQELADMLNISLSMLKRIFAEFTGIGVREYFLILKIKKAKEFLLSGSSITNTAKELQFSSQAYFSAAFKRVTGINAKAYSMGKKAVNEKIKRNSKDVKSTQSEIPYYLL